ncbi:syntaxin pep12, partial [Rhizoctonia solani AG-3 Rhs1AP]
MQHTSEQEEVIHDLREAARHSNENSTRAIAAIIVVGAILQLYFLSTLIQGSQSTPLTPILDSALEAKPLIPLASFFTILHIGVHALDIISLIPSLSELHKSIPEGVSRYGPLTTCIAPLLALFSGRDVAQLAWWSVPIELSALVWVSRGWMASAVEGVVGLEKLRYDVQGA